VIVDTQTDEWEALEVYLSQRQVPSILLEGLEAMGPGGMVPVDADCQDHPEKVRL
jgi:hypothetical protein